MPSATSKQDALLVLADRLRREEGEASHRYLGVLLQIKNKPSLWKRKFNSFKNFLDSTNHGPYDRFTRYEELTEVLQQHDFDKMKKGERRTRSTIEIVGYEAAAQILNIDAGGSRSRVIEALRAEADAEGHPLTYQAAVNTIYRVLRLKKMPTKTATGSTLRKLRAENESLHRDKTRLIQTIRVLQKRLRAHGISDALPDYKGSNPATATHH